ncbi:MAG: hypothetical protein QOK11_2628 [Pseudonocardiales bacterium]|jgi:hypothetical protein|nr:hypothetical protein [Pseudonocardiales bacterium]
MTSDPRAAVEYRVPAVDLRPGDLVNTSPGEDDWQEVLRVHTAADGVTDADVRTLVESLDGRYVVVQLTDLAPVDSGVYFASGLAMTYATDEGADHSVSDVVSTEDGVRTYLYTKYELVTVRASGN